MKSLFFVFSLITVFFSSDSSLFFDLKYKDIDGEEVSMNSYKGKYVLIVNVASECGFTPQYKDLEALYQSKKDSLVIVGFPCNQFGGQEPGSEDDIQSFCQKNYGVSFPLASKIEVKGDGQHEVYKWLTNKEMNGVESSSVKWNFHKYLIGPDGKYLASFGSKVKPMDEKILSLIK